VVARRFRPQRGERTMDIAIGTLIHGPASVKLTMRKC